MRTDLKAEDGRVRLWTRQHKNVIDQLNEHGVYRVRKEYILEKMDTISDYYLNLYDWYSRNASKIVPRPEGVFYPIWLSVSSEMMLQPTEGTVILEIEADKSEVIITDMDKWGYIVNYFYLPLDSEDEEKHNEELRRFGISNELSLIKGDNGNFYPLLKNKVMKSWERLFHPFDHQSALLQATMWEIRKEQVVNIINA